MLIIRDLTRTLGERPVLRGVDVEGVRGEILCLLGPSGCGKTTLLRIIAGLEQADTGTVTLDGASILAIPVHQRGFGLMFQDFALFPHLTVADNVAFGLRMQRMAAALQRQRVMDVLALVNLTGFEGRDVASLSGGERQRVALARSLAPNPRLLMLDEPLSSLDAALREELMVELRRIIKQLGLTAIYVTHDQHEALATADRIAVMNQGRIEQVAAPSDLYRRPATAFVARFLGLENVLPVLRWDGGLAQTAMGAFTVTGQPEAVLLHPAGLSLSADGAGIPMQVVEHIYQGDHYRLRVRHVSGQEVTFKHYGAVPSAGDTIALRIAPEWVVPLGS